MKVVQNTKSLIQQKSQARMWTYGIVAILSIAALFYIIPPVHNDNSNAMTGTSIASDTTLSISLSGSVLPLDITPTSSAGTFASTASDSIDTNTAVIHVATNNITGYTIGIKASNPNSSTADKLISDNEQCENTPTSTKCAINPLPQPVTEAQYIDNTVEGVDLNNTWGYLPSKYNSEDNTNYLPAPVSGDTIATTDSPNQENTTAGDGTLQSDEYTIDYGMRIDYSPYAGTYSTNYNNQSYIITAVGNPVPYSVSYNSNKPEQAPTEATVDNVPSAQTGTVSGGTTVAVILSSKVPTIGTTDPSTEDYTYAGYVFNGWCTVQPEVPTEINGQPNTNGYQVCPVNQPQPGQEDLVQLYHPGDNFGIDQTVDNAQTLYAVWGAPARVTFNANGLIYNNTTTETTNTVTYIPTYENNIITGNKTNTIYMGTYKTPAYEETIPATNYILKGWSTDQQATEATYENEQAIVNNLDLNAGDNIELYAIWNYATVITFNGNGNDAGNTPMADITIEAGQTEALPQNTYTKDGYVFNGWNTVQAPTEQDPGEIYADKANYTAGTGSNNVTLYAQWKLDVCDPNSICYKPNGANQGENDPRMGAQTKNYGNSYNAITSNMEVTLWPSNYKYDTDNDGYNDYGFAGWSEDKNAASKILDANPDNNPTIYGPNQTVTLGDVSTYGLKLYAVWMPVAKDSTATDLTFQTANLLTTTLADGTTLASRPNGYVTALKDQRDNQVYAVAKLADGNYWMIENLRLESSATIGNNINDPSITNESLAEGYGGAFVGLANAEFANFNSSTNANSLYNTSNITGSSPDYRFPRYNNTNTISPVANMVNPYAEVYSNGNYYTWAAAVADTSYYGNDGGHTNVKTSICPVGWHLPYGNIGTSGTNLGGTKGGFSYLDKQIGGTGDRQYTLAATNKWRSFPNNFLYSGSMSNSSMDAVGGEGLYLSTSTEKSYSAYSFRISGSYGYVFPGNNNFSKNYGYTVRCVVGE